MKNDRFLKYEDRKKLILKMFEDPEDYDPIMRCLDQLIILPDRKITKLTLLDLKDDIRSMSLNWDFFIEQNEKFMEKKGIKNKDE